MYIILYIYMYIILFNIHSYKGIAYNCMIAYRPMDQNPWNPLLFTSESPGFVDAHPGAGVIRWDPPFRGNSKWVYRMEFSEDFAGITGAIV